MKRPRALFGYPVTTSESPPESRRRFLLITGSGVRVPPRELCQVIEHQQEQEGVGHTPGPSSFFSVPRRGERTPWVECARAVLTGSRIHLTCGAGRSRCGTPWSPGPDSAASARPG